MSELGVWLRVAWEFWVADTWRGTPGPLPVKVILFAVAVAEPGPYGEIALAVFARWNGARLARKAALTP